MKKISRFGSCKSTKQLDRSAIVAPEIYTERFYTATSKDSACFIHESRARLRFMNESGQRWLINHERIVVSWALEISSEDGDTLIDLQ